MSSPSKSPSKRKAAAVIEMLMKSGLYRPQIISILIEGSPLIVILLVVICIAFIGDLRELLQLVRAFLMRPE
jgi:hypothetical protein